MRKYRNWLMGLGIGIILGSSMLQLIQLAKDQTVMVAEEPLTRDQLNEEAKKAGLVLLPADETRYTQDQLDAKVEKAVAAAQEDAKNTDTDQIDDSDAALKPPGQKKDENESPSPDAAGSGEPDSVTLYVRYGMTLLEVAEELVKLGVIEDKEDFIKKAWSISKKMNVGTAVLTGKPTYQEIMDELTRMKDD